MSAYIRGLPLWLRYLVAFICGAIIVVALVLFVNHNQEPLSVAPVAGNKQEQETEIEEDRIVVEQQEAPHVATAAAHASPLLAATTAVTAYMSREVNQGLIAGPLDGSARCTAAGGSAARAVVHCNVVAGEAAKDASLRYPFDVVVAPAAKQVTYCQVVTPPDPSLASPQISARCR